MAAPCYHLPLPTCPHFIIINIHLLPPLLLAQPLLHLLLLSPIPTTSSREQVSTSLSTPPSHPSLTPQPSMRASISTRLIITSSSTCAVSKTRTPSRRSTWRWYYQESETVCSSTFLNFWSRLVMLVVSLLIFVLQPSLATIVDIMVTATATAISLHRIQVVSIIPTTVQVVLEATATRNHHLVVV